MRFLCSTAALAALTLTACGALTDEERAAAEIDETTEQTASAESAGEDAGAEGETAAADSDATPAGASGADSDGKSDGGSADSNAPDPSSAAPAVAGPAGNSGGAAQSAAASINFGDDSSEWANDGECDDPRFVGAAMAEVLLDEDTAKDATDCRAAFEQGLIGLRG